MSRLYDWCITGWGNGSVGYSRVHRFRNYTTLILRRSMYRCYCGVKITPEIYILYQEYLQKRDIALEKYMRKIL